MAKPRPTVQRGSSNKPPAAAASTAPAPSLRTGSREAKTIARAAKADEKGRFSARGSGCARPASPHADCLSPRRGEPTWGSPPNTTPPPQLFPASGKRPPGLRRSKGRDPRRSPVIAVPPGLPQPPQTSPAGGTRRRPAGPAAPPPVLGERPRCCRAASWGGEAGLAPSPSPYPRPPPPGQPLRAPGGCGLGARGAPLTPPPSTAAVCPLQLRGAAPAP